MAPAPKARFQRRSSQSGGRPVVEIADGKSSEDTKVGEEETVEHGDQNKHLAVTEVNQTRDKAGSPLSTLLLRRSSAGVDGRMESVSVRASFDDIKQHLKHLGPSNPASNPKTTRSTTVKIKPGIVVHEQPRSGPLVEEAIPENPQDEGEEHDEGDETTSLLRGRLIPKDGAHALATSYGATGTGSLPRSFEASEAAKRADAPELEDQATQTSAQPSNSSLRAAAAAAAPAEREVRPMKSSSGSETDQLESAGPYGPGKGLFARSGSITEQVVETRGIKKTVLGTTSSNEDEDEQQRWSNRAASRSNMSLASPAVLSPVESKASTPLLSGEEANGQGGEHGGPSAEGGASSQNGGGSANGAGKKKNRRKKRKGKS